MKRFAYAAMVFLLLLASGCVLKKAPPERDLEQITIKVMGSDFNTFYSRYGALYTALHPNVHFAFIPRSTRGISDVARYVQEQSPDVLLLSSLEYEELANRGLLYDLDLLVRKDKYDLDGTIAPVISYIKNLGGGSIYGLSPVFLSRALFYNKDLFMQYKIPLPTDSMSWNDVLLLARRFPATGDEQNRIYGFMNSAYSANPFEFAVMIGGSLGLDYVDSTRMQMTIDTPQWKQVFQLVLDTMKSGVLYQGGQTPQPGMTYEEALKQDPFISGKVAMTVAAGDMMAKLQNAPNGVTPPHWDIVSAPGGAGGMEVGELFSIYNGSTHTDASWDFIRYVNGDDFADVYSRNPTLGYLTTRQKYLKDEEGHHVEAFYMIEPAIAKGENSVPQQFYVRFASIAEKEIQKAYDGGQTIDEALAAMQNQGQQLLMLEEQKQKESIDAN